MNGKLEENVYVGVPQFVKAEKCQFCKLVKAIYGLKEARIIWNRTINSVLVKANFKSWSNDYCFYTFREERRVDNILVDSNKETKVRELINLLSERFGVQDLGKIKRFLGMNIVYDQENGE